MKKYKIIICIVITIIITGVGVGAYQNHKQEQREAYVRGLYRHQWLAYPNEKRERYIYEYKKEDTNRYSNMFCADIISDSCRGDILFCSDGDNRADSYTST